MEFLSAPRAFWLEAISGKIEGDGDDFRAVTFRSEIASEDVNDARDVATVTLRVNAHAFQDLEGAEAIAKQRAVRVLKAIAEAIERST